MTTLFHFATPVQISPSFALGLLPAPEVVSPGLAKVRKEIADSPCDKPRTLDRTVLDAMWHSGYSIATEDGMALPPEGLSEAERTAWLAGRDACVMGDWDAGEWLDSELEMMAQEAVEREMMVNGCGW